MRVIVTEQPLDTWTMLRAHEAAFSAGRRAAFGANTVFVGVMRDRNEGVDVSGMFLEHYPAMTERYLNRLVEDAFARWSLGDVLLVHRVGHLEPGQPIVLIAVWSAHRRDAVEACRHLIEELKARAPFWKKEQHRDGERWVETNTPAQ